jgi:hypothetical protein
VRLTKTVCSSGYYLRSQDASNAKEAWAGRNVSSDAAVLCRRGNYHLWESESHIIREKPYVCRENERLTTGIHETLN